MWGIIPVYNIWHIVPVNDSGDHITECRQNALGIHSDCPCEPDISEEGGKFFIVHNSFDGREGLEWANEILNSTE